MQTDGSDDTYPTVNDRTDPGEAQPVSEQDQHASDTSLNAKWVAATFASLIGGVYLLDAFIRRTTLAETLDVPPEVLGSLIGDRGWAGYAARDALFVSAAAVLGWFVPNRPIWSKAASVICTLAGLLVAGSMVWVQGWVPPALLLTPLVLLLAGVTAHSARFALLDGHGNPRFAPIPVFSLATLLMLSWVFVVKGQIHGNQFSWYTKTRPVTHVLLTEHAETVAVLDGIDPAIDTIRYLGSDGAFLYLYWPGEDAVPEPSRNPRTFAVPVSDVVLTSSRAIDWRDVD